MVDYELISACWTSAGACNAGSMSSDDSSPVSITERVEAVAAAGFTGFGIRHSDLVKVEQGIGLPTFRKLLDDHGIVHLELEFLEGWYAGGEERAKSDQHRSDFLRAAETIGARHIKIGGDFSAPPLDVDRIAEELALLARQAQDAGTRVALEPMPFADVKTPQDGLRVVETANHPGAGLCIDVWHVARADVSYQSLVDIPVKWIYSIELDDAPATYEGSLIDDTFDGRLFPGEGDLEVSRFIEAMKATGYTGPWGVEMLSVEFRKLPVQEATKRAFDTSIALLRG